MATIAPKSNHHVTKAEYSGSEIQNRQEMVPGVTGGFYLPMAGCDDDTYVARTILTATAIATPSRTPLDPTPTAAATFTPAPTIAPTLIGTPIVTPATKPSSRSIHV